MKQYFLVLGYGIPKNILEDENYNFYLKSVFNKIFDWCSTHNQWDPVIIFSGGKTDVFEPFRRTEAREMIKLFAALSKRPTVKARVKGWSLVPEMRSFSTLDNLLYAAEICRSQQSGEAKIIILEEQTRHKRILTLGRKIFGEAAVIPIDFDQSANRYLDFAFIKHKESEVLKFDLWALQNPSNLKEHRILSKKKIAFFRKMGTTKHVDAVKQWWEQELHELKRYHL